MKSTGIIRKIDELGRVVLPIELRNTLEIKEKDPMEIFVDGKSIILRKYQPDCIFCSSSNNLKLYKDRLICGDCVKEMSDLK